MRPASYDITNGHFFTQTSGRSPDRDRSGYAVTNDNGVLFWDAWRRWGLENLGYPLSTRFLSRGLPTQVFQKAVLQWQAGVGIVLINLLDELHDRGFDDTLRTRERVPARIDAAAESARTWEELVRARLALLEANAAIRNYYYAAADPFCFTVCPPPPWRMSGRHS